MIFLVYSPNRDDNHQLQQEAWNVGRKKNRLKSQTSVLAPRFFVRGKVVKSNDCGRPLRQLRSDEALYIVGHGQRECGSLSGYTADALLELLVDKGLCPHTKRLNIKLVCCHSGHKPNYKTLSYAEELYQTLVSRLHVYEQRHREKEGSLPRITAPKHVIGFNSMGDAIGLKPEQYHAYARAKRSSTVSVSDWLKRHAVPLEPSDFQHVGSYALQASVQSAKYF